MCKRQMKKKNKKRKRLLLQWDREKRSKKRKWKKEKSIQSKMFWWEKRDRGDKERKFGKKPERNIKWNVHKISTVEKKKKKSINFMQKCKKN